MTASEQPKPAGDAAAFWDGRHQDPEGEAHDNFLSHPMVHAYISLRAFGSLVGHLDVVAAEIRTRSGPGARILSVGCGLAPKERALARLLPDRNFVGVDISPRTVATATRLIEEEGLGNLEVRVGDFNALDLAPSSVDLVLGLGAIHHVEELETFWAGCRHGLRPGGAVLAQEYVGPDRFQWTDAQIEEGNRALAEIVPEPHRAHHDRVERTAIDLMMALDPSEAVRSSEILPTCEGAGFELVGIAGAGCALLQPVLMGQISTYEPSNWGHHLVLARLFEREDSLMRQGVLGDDFAMFVARPLS